MVAVGWKADEEPPNSRNIVVVDATTTKAAARVALVWVAWKRRAFIVVTFCTIWSWVRTASIVSPGGGTTVRDLVALQSPVVMAPPVACSAVRVRIASWGDAVSTKLKENSQNGPLFTTLMFPRNRLYSFSIGALLLCRSFITILSVPSSHAT